MRQIEVLGSCYEALFRPSRIDFNTVEVYNYRLVSGTLFNVKEDIVEKRNDLFEIRRKMPTLLNYQEDEDVQI